MKVLLGSNSEKMIAKLRPYLTASGYTVCAIAQDSYELLRLNQALSPHLIILDEELRGGSLLSAVETLTFHKRAVIVIGKAHKIGYYSQSPYLEFSNVPVQLSLLDATIRMLVKYTDSLRKLENKVEQYELKQKTDKKVGQAKRLLQQVEDMSEDEAHRYIQKCSMERRISKLECAEEIIKKYGAR